MVSGVTRIGEYQLALDEASSIALWAYLEKERTSAAAWRWPRRRFLDQVFKAKCAEADRLKKAIAQLEADADRRAAA